MRPAIVFIVLALTLPAKAEWTVHANADRLDTSSKTTFATTEAKSPFAQNGKEVSATIVVSCRETTTDDGRARSIRQLGAYLWFSDRIGFSDRWVRWRVDEHKVSTALRSHESNGRRLSLYPPSGPDQTISRLRTGKTMKVELELPGGNTSLLEFNVEGAAGAFSKIPCR